MAKSKKHLSDGGGNRSIFTLMGENFKKNAKLDIAKKIVYVVIGGVAYPFIPAAVQGFFKFDMSGWKGVLTGGIATTLIGMLSDRMEIAAGGLGAMFTHITYVHGNGTIAALTGNPIPAFDKAATTKAISDGPPNEQLPANMKWVALPDGQYIKVMTGPAQSPAVNDYVNQPQIADYVNTPNLAPEVAKSAMNDWVNEVPGNSLSDFDPFAGMDAFEEYTGF